MFYLFQVKKVTFIDWKIDNFGCLRFDAFDFQFKVQPQVH